MGLGLGFGVGVGVRVAVVDHRHLREVGVVELGGEAHLVRLGSS